MSVERVIAGQQRWHCQCGDALAVARTLPAGCLQTIVTSPPYFSLRDYGIAGQIGLEPTPAAFTGKLVELFTALRDALADDGTLWVNMGDCYHGSWGNAGSRPELDGKTLSQRKKNCDYLPRGGWDQRRDRPASSYKIDGFKAKDRYGIPHRLVFALQADGWYWRDEIVWSKPNPMPSSVNDRFTGAHEFIFMLSKSKRYYFDRIAIQEPAAYAGQNRGGSTNRYEQNAAGMDNKVYETRNKRSVWTVQPASYKGAHFATFPPDLIRPCILAGSRPGDIVYDPFMGSGTTAAVAVEHGRRALGSELNPKYCQLVTKRMRTVTPSFAEATA